MRVLEDEVQRFLSGDPEASEARAVLEDTLGSEHEALRARAGGLLLDALGWAGEVAPLILEVLQESWSPIPLNLVDRALEATLSFLRGWDGESQPVDDVALLWAGLVREEPSVASRLLEHAGDGAWAVRRAAAGAMGRLPEATGEHVAAVAGLVGDPDPRVSEAAVEALGAVASVDPARAMPILVGEISRGEGDRRLLALSAVRGLMEEAVSENRPLPPGSTELDQSLLSAAGDPDPAVRVQAVAALGLSAGRGDAVERALSRALTDENVDVGASAATALLRLGSAVPKAVELLSGLLASESEEAQDAAFSALEPLEPAALGRARPVLEKAAQGPEGLRDAARALLERLESPTR